MRVCVSLSIYEPNLRRAMCIANKSRTSERLYVSLGINNIPLSVRSNRMATTCCSVVGGDPILNRYQLRNKHVVRRLATARYTGARATGVHMRSTSNTMLCSPRLRIISDTPVCDSETLSRDSRLSTLAGTLTSAVGDRVTNVARDTTGNMRACAIAFNSGEAEAFAIRSKTTKPRNVPNASNGSKTPNTSNTPNGGNASNHNVGVT